MSAPDQGYSVIDQAALEAIASLQVSGDNELLRNVIQIYLSHSQTLIQKLGEAVAADDAMGIMEAAHTLKSSSAQLGAARLAKVLFELEAMGRNRETSEAPRLFLQARLELEAARTALESVLTSMTVRR